MAQDLDQGGQFIETHLADEGPTLGWQSKPTGGSGGGATGPTGPPGPPGGSGGSVSVDSFYPSGVTPHTGASQPLSGIFGSLAAARARYPFVDDLTPEVDWCAIQSAIDFAFRNNLTDISLAEGNYVTSETIFLDSANSFRAQGSVLPGDYPPIAPCGPRWTAGATFSLNQVVLYNGVPYVSLQAGNTGHAPHYVATEVGNDPWWRMWYAEAATSGTVTGGALSTFTNWKATLRGANGQASQGQYGTVIKPKYLNMIAIIDGPNPFSAIKSIQIFYPYNYLFGGCNPWSCGIAIPGAGGGASGTEIDDCCIVAAYSAIRYFGVGGGLGDNNVVRRCAGNACYRFLSYPATQAYINNVYDCTPSSTVGISQAPGSVLVVGGNWSALQEGSPAAAWNVTNVSAITSGAVGGYYRLGDAFVPGASGKFLDMDVTDTIGGDFLSNAYVDGRVGIMNWFVINTPSFGPVPFTADPNAASVLNVLGTLTPGSGYVPGTYRGVALTGAISGHFSRIVDITVGAGGTVTNVKMVSPGFGYTPGEGTSTANINLGGAGAGFSIKAAQHVRLMIYYPWLDTFAPSDLATTDLQAELQAATKLYTACVVFPLQTAGQFEDLFFENANTATCLISVGGGFGAPSTFNGIFFDADMTLGGYGPFEYGINDDFHLAHYYAQRTIPFIFLNGDVILDSVAWGNPGGPKREPYIVYEPSPGSRYTLYHRNSSTQGGGNLSPPFVFWYSNLGSDPGYSRIPQRYGSGFDNIWNGDQNTAIPSWRDVNSIAWQWAIGAGRSSTSGIRPSSWTVPTLLPMDLTVLSDPQNLPAVRSMVLDGSATNLTYPLVYGNTAYKTDVASPAQLQTIDTLFGIDSKPGTTLFESSHDFFSYHQTMTAHDGGGPGVVLGMNWRAKGHSWCLFVDDNTMSFMFTGLVIGLETNGTPGVPDYYVVTGMQTGLGFVTVWPLNQSGYAASAGIAGSATTVYTGTKIWAQPYRVRYLSARPRYSTTAITAVAGEEIMADTTGAAWVLALPLNPLQGDKVTFYDAGGAFASNKLVIDGNGAKLNGSADNVSVTAGGMAIYKDTTTGWIVTGGTLTAVRALVVTPVGNTAFGGMIASPIHPASFTYTLNVSSAGSVTYSITGAPTWLTPSATSGTISGSTPITFTPAYGTLAPGSYTATLTFTNTANSQSTKRIVSFAVVGQQYAAEGDTITSRQATAGAVGYPGEYQAAIGSRMVVYNPCQSDPLLNLLRRERKLDQMVGAKRSGDRYVLSVLVGTYDLLAGWTGGSQAAFLAAYAAYLDRRRASGWYVIACTLPSANNPGNGAVPGGAIDANIAPLNTEIRKWTGTTGIGGVAHADAICDFAASTFFDAGSYSDSTYYTGDGVNPTVAGEHQLYLIIKPLLDDGFGVSGRASGAAAGTSTATGEPFVAFDPTTLFASGEHGGWWDPSDHSTTFQDTAGTTPANTAGQTVKRINDKSGNGNHLTGTVGCTLQNSGALWWLEFNGTTQTLAVTVSTFNLPVSAISAARQISYTGGNAPLWEGVSGISNSVIQNGPSPSITLYNGSFGPADATHMTVGADHVVINVAKPSDGSASTLQVDNNTVATANAGGFNPGGVQLAFDPSNGHTNIRWYGAVHIDRVLTTTETNRSRTFFGSKAGLAL